jgi:hypothetical protein
MDFSYVKLSSLPCIYIEFCLRTKELLTVRTFTCSVIGLAGAAYLTSKRERLKWCLNASECRERITNCEHRGSLIQKLGSILASVKLVFSHWTYITLAGTIAAIFWIIFNVFEQLLFSILS